MNVALAFILPLIGGYLFCREWVAIRYEMAREDGHRLYFRSAFWGAYIFLVVLLLRTILFSWSESYDQFERTLVSLIAPLLSEPGKSTQGEIALTAAYSLVVGPCLGYLIDKVTPFRPALDRALEGEDFDVILQYSMERELPVYLTLDSGKVYVGFVLETASPSATRKAITIFPLISGYRDEKHRVRFTTDYKKQYERMNAPGAPGSPEIVPEDFSLVIFVSRIISAVPFVESAYESFQLTDGPGFEGAAQRQDTASGAIEGPGER